MAKKKKHKQEDRGKKEDTPKNQSKKELEVAEKDLVLELTKNDLLVRIKKAFADWKKSLFAMFAKLKQALESFWSRVLKFLNKLKDLMLNFFKFLLFLFELIFIIVVSLSVFFSIYSYYYQDKFVPRTFFLQSDLSGISYQQALNYFAPKTKLFEEENFTFVAEGKEHLLSMEDLGISYDLNESLKQAYSKGHSDSFWQNQRERLLALASLNEVQLESFVDLNSVKEALKGAIAGISQEPQNAEVVLNPEGNFELKPGKSSVSTDFLKAYEQVRDNLLQLKTEKVFLEIREFEPEISTAEAQLALERAALMSTEPIYLYYTEHNKQLEFWIPLPQDLSWIGFTKLAGKLEAAINQDKLLAFLTTEVAPVVNQVHSNAYVKSDDKNIEVPHYIEVEGEVADGFALKVDETIVNILTAVKNANYSVALAVDYKQGLFLDKAGQDLGLRELIGVGASDFKGSDANRAYNIRYGTQLFNNILIPPDAEFSFNSFLGEVSGRTGWKLAKVIRGNGYIEPDWGGGACQISTTAYRSILNAGLKVSERSSHSLYISYYTWGPYNEQNDGTGLDATVFLGVKDLKFINDTPGYVLMQTKTEGTKAYFYLYGTKDREVTFDGPHKGGWFSSGASTIYEETTDLAPGQTQIIQKALPGMNVYWIQKIAYFDGTSVENKIESNYRATPAFGRIGVSSGPAVNLS